MRSDLVLRSRLRARGGGAAVVVGARRGEDFRRNGGKGIGGGGARRFGQLRGPGKIRSELRKGRKADVSLPKRTQLQPDERSSDHTHKLGQALFLRCPFPTQHRLVFRVQILLVRILHVPRLHPVNRDVPVPSVASSTSLPTLSDALG
jgi:hypothetical protein